MQFQSGANAGAQRIQAATVSICYAGPITLQIGEESMRIAVLQIDTTARPDLADLARVMHHEGVQQRLSNPIAYTLGDNPAMILSLRMSDPVEINATVVIEWATYRDFFFLLQDLGQMYIALGAIEDLMTNGITLYLNRAELAFIVSLWQYE